MPIAVAVVFAAACLGVGIAALTGVFNTNAPKSKPLPPTYVRPHIPPGLVVDQNAHAIEDQVRQSLGPRSVITSVVVVRHRRETQGVIGGTGPETEHGGPAWIVRARGLFEPITTPPGGNLDPPNRQSNGFVVIDDKTGRTLAYGFGG